MNLEAFSPVEIMPDQTNTVKYITYRGKRYRTRYVDGNLYIPIPTDYYIFYLEINKDILKQIVQDHVTADSVPIDEIK